jgi:hypothetical protein
MFEPGHHHPIGRVRQDGSGTLHGVLSHPGTWLGGLLIWAGLHVLLPLAGLAK